MDIRKVFVSSILNPAIEDLRAERDTAKEVVDSYSFLNAWAFEKEPASTEPLPGVYLRSVDECDLFVLIVGNQITVPVEKEYEQAQSLRKRTLIFAKKTRHRSQKLQRLLQAATVKYATFETTEELRDQVRAAIDQTLAMGLRALKEEPLPRSVPARLTKLALKKVKINVRPLIPATAGRFGFLMESANAETVVLTKVSSGHSVYIPVSRISDILTTAPSDPPIMLLDGRLQWVTATQVWKFFEEKPSHIQPLGFHKISSPHDEHARALVERLEKRGYATEWYRADKIEVRLTEGWEVIYDDDGYYFLAAGSPLDIRFILIGTPI